MVRQAACSCGLVQLTLEGDPAGIGMCHCLECQRRTGSVFGVQARFARPQLKSISGSTTQWVRSGDTGAKVTFHFCPTCGSTVYWEPEKLEGFVVVGVGGFADPDFGSPQYSVYEARQHAWVRASELPIEHYD